MSVIGVHCNCIVVTLMRSTDNDKKDINDDCFADDEKDGGNDITISSGSWTIVFIIPIVVVIITVIALPQNCHHDEAALGLHEDVKLQEWEE